VRCAYSRVMLGDNVRGCSKILLRWDFDFRGRCQGSQVYVKWSLCRRDWVNTSNRRETIPRRTMTKAGPNTIHRLPLLHVPEDSNTWQPGLVASLVSLQHVVLNVARAHATQQAMVRVVPTLPPPRNLLKHGLVQPPMPHQAPRFATTIIPHGTFPPMISCPPGLTRLNEQARETARVVVRETLASAAIGVTAVDAENSWSPVMSEEIKGCPASAPPTASLSSIKRFKHRIHITFSHVNTKLPHFEHSSK
jgi:hypothetical protein